MKPTNNTRIRKNYYKKKGALPQTTACQESRQKTEENNEKKNGPHPPTFQSYRTHHNRAQGKKKPVQPRHPPQASTQINCTGPTLHTAEPQAERKYDPAHQRNLQGTHTPKINKTRDECNKWINTHKTPPANKTKKKDKPTRIKTIFKEIKTT
jgi:hypothetical protein